MIKLNIHYVLIIFITLSFVYGCSKIRDSAGVNRISPDEYKAIENPPLVMPPDYNLVPPDQLKEKDINNIETELAEEILFGLDEKKIIEENQLSTMNLLLLEANTGEVSNAIRDEIDEDFAKEMNSEDKFGFKWEDEQEVLDAIKESERIREKKFNNKSIVEGDTPIKKQKVKRKKKKRFFIF